MNWNIFYLKHGIATAYHKLKKNQTKSAHLTSITDSRLPYSTCSWIAISCNDENKYQPLLYIQKPLMNFCLIFTVPEDLALTVAFPVKS